MTMLIRRLSSAPPGSGYSDSQVFTNTALANTTYVEIGSIQLQAGPTGTITVDVSGTIEWAGSETPNNLTATMQMRWRTAGVGGYTSLTEQAVGSDSNDDPAGEGSGQLPSDIAYAADVISGLTPNAEYEIAVWGKLNVDANDPWLFASGTLAGTGT